MPRIARPLFSSIFLSLLCLAAGSQTRVGATTFRDRAAFTSAAQNLRTLDFEGSQPSSSWPGPVIDGIAFHNNFGGTGFDSNGSNQVLYASGIGEITFLTIILPPGTTAVGLDCFTRSMEVATSTGEKVFLDPSDSERFVGFVSASPIAELYLKVDFPEPTATILIDNLTFGQRRAGNEPPAPLLLTKTGDGRAAALDSVALLSEPFTVQAAHQLSLDGHTRLTLFLVGVRFTGAGDVQTVTARAEDSQQRVFTLPVEGVGMVKNLSWMAQVTVRLPDELSGAGDVQLSIAVKGASSNKVLVRINPPAN